VAKVKVEKKVEIDSLAEWIGPMLDAVRDELRGSKTRSFALPRGRAGLVVTWRGFYGRNVTKRIEMVREVIAKLDADASKRISTIFAYTPGEAAGIDSSD
jgi:hypothetical protein